MRSVVCKVTRLFPARRASSMHPSISLRPTPRRRSSARTPSIRTFWDPAEFAELIAELDRRGFQIFTHAIGDRGIRTALDAIEHAQRVNGPRDARHQLVHVECLSPQDIPRFRELGVVPCMQPRHCAPDIVGEWRENVGPDRSRFAWAFRSLEEADAPLAFSSDWNVAEMDQIGRASCRGRG